MNKALHIELFIEQTKEYNIQTTEKVKCFVLNHWLWHACRRNFVLFFFDIYIIKADAGHLLDLLMLDNLKLEITYNPKNHNRTKIPGIMDEKKMSFKM